MGIIMRAGQVSGIFSRFTAAFFVIALMFISGCGGGDEAPNFSIGGQVSGLRGEGGSVTLQNNGERLTVSANGSFVFKNAIALGGSYSVTVVGQTQGQTCSVANNSGAGAGVNGNIASVRIVCSVFSYSVGGNVTGLQEGSSVTLLNNGTDTFTSSANGSFTFATPVAFGGSYNITVGTQPRGQICSVSSGTGSGINADVTSVSIVCSTSTFSLGGNLSGASNTVTLSLNGGDFLSLGSNGAFNFASPIAFGGSYNVAVSTNPIGQTCTANNGVGSNVTADVTNIDVLCSTNTYTIGGSVAGLQGTVTLNLNGGSPLSIGTNGGFTFTTPVSFGGNYSVTVATQPIGQTCTVGNGVGSFVTANVNNATINCTNNVFTIGGNVTGLQGTLTLNLNGGSPFSFSGNGSFVFPTPVAFGANYTVTVAAQPIEQTCTVGNGTGSFVTANVSNVTINCAANGFAVGGRVTGLAAGTSVTLSLNGDNDQTLNADGSYTFPNLLINGTSYFIGVSFTQPSGKQPQQYCAANQPSGIVNGPVNVLVTCQPESVRFSEAGEFTYVIPPGISQISVEVVGAGGGGSGGSDNQGITSQGVGGSGGGLSALVDVVPGSTLTLQVGGGGAGGPATRGELRAATYTNAAGGGGSSNVLLDRRVLIVSGGGGGAGGALQDRQMSIAGGAACVDGLSFSASGDLGLAQFASAPGANGQGGAGGRIDLSRGNGFDGGSGQGGPGGAPGWSLRGEGAGSGFGGAFGGTGGRGSEVQVTGGGGGGGYGGGGGGAVTGGGAAGGSFVDPNFVRDADCRSINNGGQPGSNGDLSDGSSGSNGFISIHLRPFTGGRSSALTVAPSLRR
jgi:large repetitive protein